MKSARPERLGRFEDGRVAQERGEPLDAFSVTLANMAKALSRRRALKRTTALFVAPAWIRAQPAHPLLTGRVARYMTDAATRDLPAKVVEAAKHRILDTFSAMVSGARLKPGEAAIRYARTLGGPPEACIATTRMMTSAVNAALINALFAHSDETDDFHAETKAHPGCSSVPAALAMAERQNRSGLEMIRAVTLGYDLCCRFLLALGADHVRETHRSAEGYSSTFGATAAAAALAGFDEKKMRYALSYAAQQVSGVWSWQRDEEHIEKAFDFAGMGARNGVTAVTMIQAGFTGVPDALEGEHNVLDALSAHPYPERMAEGLGQRFFIEETAIKTFPVGYPVQSPLSAFLQLRKQHQLTPDNVEHIDVRLPADGAGVVDNRAMPDVNCQHLIAVALVDGEITFENSHDAKRMTDPKVAAVRPKITLIADKALMAPEAPRSGFVEVTLAGGRKVNQFVRHPPGTPENPLDTAAVNEKARGLMRPVLGPSKTDRLIAQVNDLEKLPRVSSLRSLLMA
jgi:2-methylcitrate dehydratase PrpD